MAIVLPPSPKVEFIDQVAQGSGLSRAVVETWVRAEGGPNGNPLNIGPGRNYGSVSNAVAATLRVLRQSNMAGILRAGQSGNDKAQLAAITASPWDACHYRGTLSGGRCANAAPGTLLLGIYRTLTGKSFVGSIAGDITGGIGSAAGAVESGVVTGAGAVADPFTDIWGGVSGVPHAIEAAVKDVETWTENAALRALGYIVLTVVAILFFDQGLKRALGLDNSPLGAARKAATSAAGAGGAAAAGAGEIPF